MAYRAGAELIDMEFLDYQIVTAAPEQQQGGRLPREGTGLRQAGAV
jgi:succinate dehydrogenase/fumarate reductase flavoprotein subunit